MTKPLGATQRGRAGGRDRHWWRRLPFLLLMVLSLMLAACGSGNGGGGDTGGEASPDAAGDGGDTETETEAGGVSGEPVKIGALVTISGPAANIGSDQRDGMEIAVEQLNANGGILGRPVELVIKDDGGDPTQAAQAMRELVDQEGVQLMFGPTLSSPTLAAAEIAVQAGVIEFTTASAQPIGDTSTYPTVFRMAPSSQIMAETFLAFLESNGWTSPGIIAVNNALGEAFTTTFDEVLANSDSGIEVVATEFHESGAVDLVPQVTRLRDAGADVLMVINTAAPDQIATVQARNQVNWDVPAVGFSTLADPQVRDAVDDMSEVFAGQQYLTLTEGNADEQSRAFLDLVRAKRGSDVLERDVAQTATGFDAVMMIADTVNGVGSMDDPQTLREYREANVYDGAKATYEYTAERHDGEGLDDLVFVLADSFEDGLYTIAPGSD